MSGLTETRLRELLHYEPATGEFAWRSDRRQMKAGERAGCITEQGYRRIRIDGHGHQAHRLAWLYVNGRWPEHEVDHINGIRTDNRWPNLRNASDTLQRENLRNAQRNNKTGLLGVVPNRARFRAQICVNAQTVDLGTYTTPQEAHAAYLKAKRHMHAGATI